VQRASGIPHALFGGERFFNGSGAWRGEIVKVCLQTMRLFEDEFGVGAERGLRSRHKAHPSCPDLIRASINLRNKFFQRGWITGSSSAKTRGACHRAALCADPLALLPGDDDLNGYDGLFVEQRHVRRSSKREDGRGRWSLKLAAWPARQLGQSI
jgi:hypothetical protein